METLGRKIFRQRRIRGFSQEELAELVGVSRQAVSRWEADAAQPTFDNLQILCAVLKVSITYFTNDSSDTDETPPGPVLSGAEAVFSESETIPQSAEPADGDLSEEISASDAAATLKAEKRRKRAYRFVLAAIICIGVLIVAGILVAFAIGISVFSPNMGYSSVNSYSLKPEIFVYFLLVVFIAIITEIVLILIFYKNKKM